MGSMLLLLLVAAGVRLAAARGPLWLDEIWTLGPQILGKVRTLGDVFRAIHHENNHYGNTLWAWFLGGDREAVWYRLPSVFAGVWLTWCGWRLGLKRSWPAAVGCASLMAGSYLLIHYGSEARGYAWAVTCLLGGWLLRDRLTVRPAWWVLVAIAVVECCGIAAQPVFVCHLIGVLTLAFSAAIWGNRSERPQGRRGIFATLPALAWLAWLYAVDLGRAFNAGGTLYPRGLIARQVLSLLWGGPLSGAGLWWGAGVGGILCVGAAVVLWNQEKPFVKYALVAGVLAPWGILIAEARAEVYPRYFLPGVTCALAGWGLAFGSLWMRRGWWRWVAGGMLWLVLACQGRHVARLLDLGRGDPDQLVGLVAAATPHNAPPVQILSDQVFRFETWLGPKRLAGPPELRFVAPEQARLPPADWLVLQRTELEGDFPDRQRVGPFTYELRHVVSGAGLSGWSTGLYIRKPR